MHSPRAILAKFTLLCICCISLHINFSSEEDMDALLELKRAFNNPKLLASWTINTTGAPCTGWKGVTCASISNTSYVVSISLPKLRIGGQISPAIGLLTHLQMLDLSHNKLIGPMPSQISNLTNLISLNLSFNNLSGTLALDWSSMTQLIHLTLSGNSFQGTIPHTISAVTSLQWLRMEHNNLSGSIPPEIFKALRHLQYFAVEHNSLTGPIPVEICNCTTLRSVYAGHNNLSGCIPTSIGNLRKLLHFEVEDNNISGPVPADFSKLSNSLRSLNLSGNDLMGLIPPSLATKFNSSSFAGNLNLCGPPLPTICPPQPGFNKPYPGIPDNGMRMKHNSSLAKATLVGMVAGGAATLCLVLIALAISLKRPQRQQQQASQIQELDNQNWFSTSLEETRRQGHYEMFTGTLRCTYDQIVYNAGHYDTAHVLGKGRFAVVYKSVFPDGTHLAVKVFKQSKLPASFERDIEFLASIRHPNVLNVRGMYSDPIEKAIFYDYLPSGTLYTLLHGDQSKARVLPDWAARQRIALGVAQALLYLHQGSGLRLVHKDVKSTNILLQDNMVPRLTDIGLLQVVSGNPDGVVKTPGYTAPEVLTAKKYTEKSDVYSFGVVLLELITGRQPWPQPPMPIFDTLQETSKGSEILRDWAIRLYAAGRRRELYDVVALTTCPRPIYIERALELAVQCVDDDPRRRPVMSEVAATIATLDSVPSPLRRPAKQSDDR